jgi:hypothetical protein
MCGVETSRLPNPSWFPQVYSHLNRFVTSFVGHTVVLSLFAGKLVLIFVINVQIILLHCVLGAFAKLRKATISFVTSVRAERIDLHWMEFNKIDIWVFFEKLSRTFKFH